VQLGTRELKVIELLLAKLAGEHFELIGNIFDFVSQEAKEFIVHLALLEHLYKLAVFHLVKD
jgi:hypothetical protein